MSITSPDPARNGAYERAFEDYCDAHGLDPHDDGVVEEFDTELMIRQEAWAAELAEREVFDG